MSRESDYGFPPEEFEARVARAQKYMREHRFDGLLLSGMDNVRYFTGLDSSFWESYTRPWFVLVPADGIPTAIIPEIGRAIVESTWITKIISWPSPRPEDEGTSLLVQAISELPRRFGRVGAELGRELRIGMPVAQLNSLIGQLRGVEIADGADLIWQLRMVKSAAEVRKIQHSIDIAGEVYAAVPDFVRIGDSERKILRNFRSRLNEGGAATIPTLICRADVGGPFEITGGPRERPIADGDMLFIDTGTTFDGYFCDYDRNFRVGSITDELRFAQEKVWDANEVGLNSVRPGVTAGYIFQQMANSLSSGGQDLNNNGRMGHGLGLRLTEPPSVRLEDVTVLVPGMVLCVEPALEYQPGKIVLHEETVVVTEDGCRLLTPRAPRELPQIS